MTVSMDSGSCSTLYEINKRCHNEYNVLQLCLPLAYTKAEVFGLGAEYFQVQVQRRSRLRLLSG